MRVFLEPGELPAVKIKDQRDLPILSAAISARAAVFVTGDKELLDIGRIKKLAILSPRQFWEKLKVKPRRRAKSRKSRRSH